MTDLEFRRLEGKLAYNAWCAGVRAQDEVWGSKPKAGDINDQIAKAVAKVKADQLAEEEDPGDCVLSGPKLRALQLAHESLEDEPYELVDAVMTFLSRGLARGKISPAQVPALVGEKALEYRRLLSDAKTS